MRPDSSASAMKTLEGNAAVLRVVPAQKRLGADDCVVREPDDRLVVQPQEAVLQRVAQRGFEGVLAQPVLGEVGVEELEGVAPQLLRVIHRDVGVLQELLGIVRIVGVHADADRGGHVDVVLLDLERLGDRFEQLPRGCVPASRARRSPRRRPLNSSPPSRARRSLSRNAAVSAALTLFRSSSPIRWPRRVVDVLEPVEVDEQHADATAAALGLRDRLRQPLVQQQAVGQSRQRIARGHVLQAFLGPDPQRHVLHERQDRDDVAAIVEQARVVPLAPDRLPVLAAVPREAGRARLFAAHEARQEFRDPRRGLRHAATDCRRSASPALPRPASRRVCSAVR